jgi:hypothetical protein
MFHATAPISLILSPRQKIVPAIAIDLIINKTPSIPLPALVMILPPATFNPLLHLALIHVTIFIPDSEPVLTQLLSLDLFELVFLLLGVVCVLFSLNDL